jgi:protein ImuA
MAKDAVARETVFSLRRQIAKIEGTLPERLETPADAAGAVVRRGGVAGGRGVLPTGVDRLDAVLGGGLPDAALVEIHGAETRDAGAVTGFVLALVGLALAATARGAVAPAAPVLWIGTAEIFRETGFPYAGGLQAMFGIDPGALLFCEAKKAADALWVAEEAARLTEPAAVVLEIRGNPRQLDLTATRRLHARARDFGRPLFLLRQAGSPAPTAAPVRLVVEPASSALRETIAGPLSGSIGRPAFTVTIGKSGSARPGRFTLEWNRDERTFEERQEKRATDPLVVVPLPRHGTDPAAAAGTVLAFKPLSAGQAGRWPAGDQPSRGERAPRRGPRRAG